MSRRIRMGLAAALCAAGALACEGSNAFTGSAIGTGGSGSGSQEGSIQGTVTADGAGIGGISVIVANRDSTTTTGTGRYVISNLGPATYTVSVRVPISYELAAGQTNPRTVTVPAGGITNADFQLRRATTTP